MDLFDKRENVDSKDELIEFIKALRHDLQVNPEEWENLSLAAFLEAMESWMEDTIDMGYLSDQPEWKSLAAILYMGKIYE
ncbi:hypothetical protein ACFU8X_20110 [Brevibacillus porteri]|uniref:DUF7660 domain-containing protein n=1 Tax=Brevibacillus porteri TaxID=2126350 RepID=A0ABX5FFN1_9BACL|nr:MULTISPECIES: hypothetical protein [Brevibacillus]MDC0760563.1 hypothetical protein [Brevibacillus sp. AG]MED1803135.1 hypothetical protein [Brevibacillus porteri]MED2135328.1 hypothetical protein [Brevibacillus porteri]MED2748731.1 hypothetical protein [Brevibacillus porteri]MED2818416.1 hypothetical protein [Brevibacillus porteri]